MKKRKKWEVVIAPGAAWGIPKKDLVKIMNLMAKKAKDRSLFAESRPVDMEKLKKEEPQVYEQVQRGLRQMKVLKK